MPASKHRKKGQPKAVKRPGRARVTREPDDVLQQRRLERMALDALGADDLGDDDFDLATYTLELLCDEVLALNVEGTLLVPCIGSRQAVVDAFCDGFMAAFGKAPGFEAVEARRAAAEHWLGRLAEVGFVRFEEDQAMLAVAVPAPR